MVSRLFYEHISQCRVAHLEKKMREVVRYILWKYYTLNGSGALS